MKIYNSKPIFIGIFLCWMSITLSIAQNADTLKTASSNEKAFVLTSKLERELVLSKDQSNQVYQLLTDRFEEISAKRKLNKLSLSELDKINLKAQEKLSVILTTDQYNLYQNLKQSTKNQKEAYKKENPAFVLSDQDKEMDF